MKLPKVFASVPILHYVGIAVLSVIVFAAIVITTISKQPQHTIDANTCKIGGDIMLIIDTSNSMNDPTNGKGGQSKLQAAIAAATTFVNIVQSYNNNDRIGLVTFNVTAQLNQALTTNYSAVINALNSLPTADHTCTQCGINTTNTQIKNNPKSGVNKVAILLTDGLANWCDYFASTDSEDQSKGEACALSGVQTAYSSTNTYYFTIGLGKDVNSSFLQQIVSDTGGKGQYYFSPTTNQLQKIYTQISQSCLPPPPGGTPTAGPTPTPVPQPSTFSISGNVYVDTNSDQQFTTPPDESYTGSTSTIYVYNSSGGLVKQMTTTNGAFTTGNILSAGKYTVTYTPLPSGYYMSYPKNISPPSYIVTTGVNCAPGNYNDVACVNGSVIGVDFGINNAVSWVQAVCGDVRVDTGIINHIPAAPSCGGTAGPYDIMSASACTNSPGVAYTGSTNADFGSNGGQASSTNWVVGGSAYSESFKPSSSSIMHTSYAYLTAKVRQSGVPTTDLSTICTLSNCTLPANLAHGVYTANGDVSLHGFTAPTTSPPSNYVFLINGNLTLNNNISIPKSSSATMTFSVSGNTTVSASVGTALNTINLDASSQQSMSNVTGTTVSNAITLDNKTQNSQNATSISVTKDASSSKGGSAGFNTVTVDSKSSGNAPGTAGTTTLQLNHTTNAHPNNILVVSVALDEPTMPPASITVSSIKYGGQSLQKLTSLDCGYCRDEIWYVKNPTTGTNTINITVGGNANVTAGAVTYYNVNLSNPFDTPVTSYGSSTTTTVTVPSNNTQLVIDSFVAQGNDTFAPGSGQSQLWNLKPNNTGAGSSQSGAAGNTTMSWSTTGAADHIGQIGVAMNPSSAAGTLTWNHTTGTQGNMILVVGVALQCSGSVAGITYNGTALAVLKTVQTSTNSCDDELWYLKNPSSGTHAITVTFSGTPAGFVAGATTYYNVDLTNPFGTAVTNAGTGTSTISVTVPSSANQLVIDAAWNKGTNTLGPGQTQQWYAQSTGGNVTNSSGSSEPGGSSNTVMSWTQSTTTEWADIGIPLNPLTISGSTLTWTHATGSQTAQNTRILVVNVSLGNTGTSVSGITCVNGTTTQTLTQLAGFNYGNGRDEMWYFKSPLSGTCSITVSITGGSPAVAAQAETYYNVDTTAALTAVTNSGTSTTPTVIVSSSTNQLVIDSLSQNGSTTYSVGPGQTVALNITAPLVNASSYETANGSGNTTMSWSGTSQNWGEIGVALTPTTTTTNATVTWTHTIGAESNRLLMVGIALHNTTSSVVSITYNNVNLTNLTTVNCTTGTCRDEVWYIKEANLPAAGSYPLVVTISGSSDFVGGAASFYNVDQTAALSPYTTANSNSTFTLSVPSSTNQLVFDALAAGGNGGWNPGPGQTMLWTNNSQQFSAGSYSLGANPSTPMTWTNDTGSDAYAEAAVALTGTSGGSSPSSNLDGFYSTDGSFIINSNGNCSDTQLNIAGSIVVGAGLQSGTFQNNRDLCSQNATCPSVTFTQRPDLILNAPDFVKTTNHIWQEVAP